MILKAFSSREEIEVNNLDKKFIEDISFQEEDFTFIGGFNLHNNRRNKEIIATVSAIFFDENKIYNEHEDIVDISDMIDADVYGAMKALSKSKVYKQEIHDDKVFTALFSCYIQRLYVYPNYRKKGIARYIFKNLDQIFLHCFNTEIHCFVIVPKPQQPIKSEKYEKWENNPDEDGLMLKRMIKLLKMEGYTKIGKTEFYVKNYASYELSDS